MIGPGSVRTEDALEFAADSCGVFAFVGLTMTAARFQESRCDNNRRRSDEHHGNSLADCNWIFHRFRSTFNPSRTRLEEAQVAPTCCPLGPLQDVANSP